MNRTAWALAAGLQGLAGGAGAGGFAPTGSVLSVPGAESGIAALEWVRIVGPQMGRDVVVAGDGASVATIEWHRDVSVRVRTESGATLSPAEQAAVRDLALDCRQGAVRAVATRTEPNGTFVVEYDCVWLQGS